MIWKLYKYRFILLFIILMIIQAGVCFAADNATGIPIPKITFDMQEAKGPNDVAMVLKILALTTILSLAPSIIMMTTSFMRVFIVFEFIRRAIGLQQSPPNQVLAAFSIFLTFFIMAPTIQEIKTNAYDPYMAGTLDQKEAMTGAINPIRHFMLRQTRERDLKLFVKLGNITKPKTPDDIPTYVLIPSFVISELHTAFVMGIYIFIPFIIIDMVVASTLMSMGMIMLPPVVVSLPFKILLFVVADGWNLITYSVVAAYQ